MPPYKYHHILKKQRKKKYPLNIIIQLEKYPLPPHPIFIQTFLLMKVYYALIILNVSDWKLRF